MMSILVLTLAAQLLPPGDDCQRTGDRCRGARARGGIPYALFEAFPTSGAGTSGACSTTAPTGAKGETLTFTRTGNATCSRKGLATTGIADGDLVVLASNVARVEPDADGVLGLRVEGARTNSVLRSEEIDNASWVNDGAKPPTITANYATAPDGTATADRMQTQAISVAEVGDRAQIAACPTGGLATLSVYARAVSGTPTLDICINTGTVNCRARATLTADSWTRLTHTATVTSNGHVLIGNHNTNGAASAGDILVWGAQCEAGAYATSYIPTTSAAVTRNAEFAYFDSGALRQINSIASSYQVASTSIFGTARGVVSASDTIGTSSPPLASIANGGRMACFANGPGYASTGAALLSDRLACFIDAALDINFLSQTSGAATTVGTASGTARYFFVGSWNVTVVNTGCGSCIVSRVCADPDSQRCR